MIENRLLAATCKRNIRLHLHSAPLSDLLEEAARPHVNRGAEICIDDTTGALVYYTRALPPAVPVAEPSPALAPTTTLNDPQHPPTSAQPTSHQAAVSGIEPATENSAPANPATIK